MNKTAKHNTKLTDDHIFTNLTMLYVESTESRRFNYLFTVLNLYATDKLLR